MNQRILLAANRSIDRSLRGKASRLRLTAFKRFDDDYFVRGSIQPTHKCFNRLTSGVAILRPMLFQDR